MKRTMIRETILTDLHVLSSVVAAGGISAAAALAGVSKSSISTRVSRLESVVGVRLLSRSRTGAKPTNAGERLLELTRRVQGDLDEAIASIRSNEQDLAGELRLSCPAGIVDALIVPLLASFLEKQPAISVDVRATDEIIDPRQAGIDLAFRFGWLHGAESGLVARRIGTYQGMICASPKYLASRPPILKPGDLLDAAWIGYSEFGGTSLRLKLRDRLGRSHSLQLTSRVRTSSALQVKSWALAGLGATRLPEFFIRDELASGTLVRLLPTYTFAEPSLYALYARDRYRPTRLRALVSHLTAR